MASVYLTFGLGGGGDVAGRPAYYGAATTEKFTSSGTAAATSTSAAVGQMITVFCATAVIINTVGATATQTAGRYIPGGIPVDIIATQAGTLSIIDAT